LVLWSRASDGFFHSRSWDDSGFAVVYCPASGDTHLLESLSLDLLNLIPSLPQTAESLAVAFSPFVPADDHDDIREFVELTLLKFSEVGLVVSHSL